MLLRRASMCVSYSYLFRLKITPLCALFLGLETPIFMLAAALQNESLISSPEPKAHKVSL